MKPCYRNPYRDSLLKPYVFVEDDNINDLVLSNPIFFYHVVKISALLEDDYFFEKYYKDLSKDKNCQIILDYYKIHEYYLLKEIKQNYWKRKYDIVINDLLFNPNGPLFKNIKTSFEKGLLKLSKQKELT